MIRASLQFLGSSSLITVAALLIGVGPAPAGIGGGFQSWSEGREFASAPGRRLA